MKEIPEYNNVMNAFEALLMCMDNAKNHDEYKTNPKTHRAFALTITNIEQAQMWAEKGFYERYS